MKKATLMLSLSVVGLLAGAAPASADPCAPFVARMFSNNYSYGSPSWYDVLGTRVVARGADGFSSFTMSPSYRPSMGMSNPASALRSWFSIYADAGRTLAQGRFMDVFPGRSDGNADSTSLRIRRSGAIELIQHAWGDTTYALTNLQCYPGHTGDAFVITGTQRTPGYGLNVNLLIVPNWLI